jgi:hypothetical protein
MWWFVNWNLEISNTQTVWVKIIDGDTSAWLVMLSFIRS